MAFSRLRMLLVSVAALPLLGGCKARSFALLSPDSITALDERNLMLIAAALMLIVVVPVWLLTFLFVRRYRADRGRGRYDPDWCYSRRIDMIVWLVPAAIVAVLGYLVWTGTHRLDPYRALDTVGRPLIVKAVAQDWRWLFIYPDQHIATINELVLPAGRPVRLTLTSDTVMNAFFVPGLTSQIYAMAGMKTVLNLRADTPATFTGRNTQFSGKDFAHQRFRVRATTPADFDSWVGRVRSARKTLDVAAYDKLVKRRGTMPVTHYSSVAPNLFDAIVGRYRAYAGNAPRRRAATPAAAGN